MIFVFMRCFQLLVILILFILLLYKLYQQIYLRLFKKIQTYFRGTKINAIKIFLVRASNTNIWTW